MYVKIFILPLHHYSLFTLNTFSSVPTNAKLQAVSEPFTQYKAMRSWIVKGIHQTWNYDSSSHRPYSGIFFAQWGKIVVKSIQINSLSVLVLLIPNVSPQQLARRRKMLPSSCYRKPRKVCHVQSKEADSRISASIKRNFPKAEPL